MFLNMIQFRGFQITVLFFFAVNSNDLKKIKTTVDNLYLEKQKIEKGQKAKKNKGKGKAILRMEGDNVSIFKRVIWTN